MMSLEPTQCAKSLLELERKQSIGNVVNYDLYSRISFLFGPGKLANGIKDFALHLMSPVKPSPSIYSDTRIWSALNVGILAQQLMLASAAYGIDSQPMEGFDERRLQMKLKVPDRYFIPLVISLGYSNESNIDSVDMISSPLSSIEANHVILKGRLRFPLEDICFLNEFGHAWDVNEEQA